MSQTVNVSFVHGYSRELKSLVQQRETKLRRAVRVETGLTGKSYNFERLGASDLQTVNTRHAATPILNPVHSRRRVTPTDKAGGILLDPQDELKMLIEPRNKYAMNHAASVNRFFDDQIISALTGNSTSVDEDDATSSITLASWDSGSHEIASGGTGLTFEKVNQVVRLLNEDDVPLEERFFAISPQALEDLLVEPELTSSDFSTLQALRTGSIAPDTMWMGFKWIVSTRLALSSTTRSCIAWQKDAMGLGIWEDIFTSIDILPETNYATQVYARVSAGAVRIEEAGVVKCDITES